MKPSYIAVIFRFKFKPFRMSLTEGVLGDLARGQEASDFIVQVIASSFYGINLILPVLSCCYFLLLDRENAYIFLLVINKSECVLFI